jgi:hypothetical protein
VIQTVLESSQPVQAEPWPGQLTAATSPQVQPPTADAPWQPPIHLWDARTGIHGLVRECRREAPGEALLDRVHFSAFAPPVVRPGAAFLLSVWAWQGSQREEMLRRASQGAGSARPGRKAPSRCIGAAC